MLLCCHIAYTPQLLARAEQLSLPQRRAKADGIKNEKAKAASLAAGLLLRYGLCRAGIKNAELVLLPSGKPALATGAPYFSLSHSGDYAACIIEPKPVGVDIQRVVGISKKAITRFCTTQEQEYLKHCDNAAHAAICIWALKESYLKAAEAATKSVFEKNFRICNDGTVIGPEGYNFTLYQHALRGYVMAVCRQV